MRLLPDMGPHLQTLNVIQLRKPEFWVFVATNTFFAQIGLLGSLVLIPLLGGGKFVPLLAAQLKSASFLVFAISLLVTAYSPVILEYVRDKTAHFRSIKAFLGLAIGALVVIQAFASGIVLTRDLSAQQSVPCPPSSTETLASLLGDHWIQISLYVISIGLSIYTFCITQIHYDLDNYAELDDKERDELGSKTMTQSTASDGLKLTSPEDEG